MNIHEHMAEKIELAGIYASDGAFLTAARILRQLADTIEKHVADCDAEFEIERRK